MGKSHFFGFPKPLRHAGRLSGLDASGVRRRAFLCLRIVLAALILFAASFKSYGILAPRSAQEAGKAIVAVVLLETALAAFLLLCDSANAWRIGILVFAVFTVVAASKWARGDTHCGCFGRLSVSPAISLTIDLAALTALLLLRPDPSFYTAAHRRLWAGAAVAWLGIAVFLSAAQVNRVVVAEGVLVTDGGYVLLSSEKWIGHELPILQHLQRPPAGLASGAWTVMLLRPGCAHCEDALTRWRGQPANGGRLVIQTARGDAPSGAVQLASDKTWLVDTPLFLRLQDGRVAAVSSEPPDVEFLDEDVSRREEG
jgi:hypothetical protein